MAKSQRSSPPFSKQLGQSIVRAALYARVSTSNGQQNPEMQLIELREYCRRRGWQVAGEYVDLASGSKERRPELDRLLSAGHKRHFDAVGFTDMTVLHGRYASW